MSISIAATVTLLKAAADKADFNGNRNGNGILSTKEIRDAVDQKKITKAQGAMLQRISFTAGNSADARTKSNIKLWTDVFAEAAVAADSDGDGALTKVEARASKDDFVASDGSPLRSVRSALQKFAAVSKE